MTIPTNTSNLLDNPPIPVQAKIAAAWTSFMLLYIYVDYYHLYKPGVVDDIRAGNDPTHDGAILCEIRYTIRDTHDPRSIVYPFYIADEEG